MLDSAIVRRMKKLHNLFRMDVDPAGVTSVHCVTDVKINTLFQLLNHQIAR